METETRCPVDRRVLGAMGEEVACRFLAGRGLVITDRNVHVAGGEIDVLALHDGVRVAVEVRSRWLEEPLDAFDGRKHGKVLSVARRLGPVPHRVDLVAVRFHEGGADMRWIPGID